MAEAAPQVAPANPAVAAAGSPGAPKDARLGRPAGPPRIRFDFQSPSRSFQARRLRLPLPDRLRIERDEQAAIARFVAEGRVQALPTRTAFGVLDVSSSVLEIEPLDLAS